MKVVSAYKPIEPYMEHHVALAHEGFDWIDALRMLAHSARVHSGVETFAITSVELPLAHYRYETHEDQLMLWVLEVQLAYLQSAEFDRDTIFLAQDCLVLKPLDLFGRFDIALIARWPKTLRFMNGLQWWPLAARDKLITLYQQCLDIARCLSPEERRWGADTIPLVQLLGPLDSGGWYQRSGLRVRVFPSSVMSTISEKLMNKIRTGRTTLNPHDSTVVDFKELNKRHMKEYFERAFPGVLP